MPFSGELGHHSSLLGGMILGIEAESPDTEGTDTLYPEASNTLTFTQDLSASFTYIRDANQALTISQSLNNQTIRELDVNHTLTFSGLAEYFLGNGADSELVFSQIATVNVVYTRNVSQTLTLTQQLTRNTVTWNRTNNQTLTFFGNAFAFDLGTNAAQSLTFVQDVHIFRNNIHRISHALLFNQEADAVHMGLRQQLTFIQKAVRWIIPNRTVSHSLTFTQQAVANKVYTRDINQTLVFNSITYRPSPISDSPYIIPAATYSIVNKNRCLMILESSNESVVLPCPKFGDNQALMNSVIIKRSMNNVLYTYIRRNELQKLVYSFSLGRVKSLELQQFCRLNIGRIIRLSNWKGEIWLVNIISNPLEFTPEQLYLNEYEKVDIQIEFQGIRIAG